MGIVDRTETLRPERIVVALRQIACRLRRALKCDAYRPERHYMRGPGPKARAQRTDLPPERR